VHDEPVVLSIDHTSKPLSSFAVRMDHASKDYVLFGASKQACIFTWETAYDKRVFDCLENIAGARLQGNPFEQSTLTVMSEFPVGSYVDEIEASVDTRIKIRVYFPSKHPQRPETLARVVKLLARRLLETEELFGILFINPFLSDLSAPIDCSVGERSTFPPSPFLTITRDWRSSRVNITEASAVRARGRTSTAAAMILAGAALGTVGFGAVKQLKLREKLVGSEEDKAFGKYTELKLKQRELSKVKIMFEQLAYSSANLSKLREALLDHLEDTAFLLGESDDDSSGSEAPMEDDIKRSSAQAAEPDGDDEDEDVIKF
jgi:hypothetical protein